MAETQWYYARNDQQFGPVSATELKQLADSGGLAPDDLLWREGMDAWTTAVNFRGLFAENPPASPTKETPSSLAPVAATRTARAAGRAAEAPSLDRVLRATQMILWGMCVLVVLVGVALFTRAFLIAENASEEAAAGAVFCTFFVGAYVLARCGEKLCGLLAELTRRRG